MPVSRAAGYPDYTNSGTSRFIPEIWSGKMVVKFYKSTCLSEISNTDYEGEIKDVGDTVIIRSTPTIAINDYYKGQKLSYETPESTPVELLIDKAKYWAFGCDDIDVYQADIKLLENWSMDAAEQMKIGIEENVWDNIYDDMSSSNTGATAGAISSSFDLGASTAPVQVTKANVLDYIIDCGVVLDEQNVPETDRWFVIPAWMAGLIKKSDLKDASLTGDSQSPLRNGRIGMIDRFTLYSSNTLYSVTDTVPCYYSMFGHKSALTFASQITKTEQLRAESTFADLVRGLQVYGYKVIKPEALGTLYCRK